MFFTCLKKKKKTSNLSGAIAFISALNTKRNNSETSRRISPFPALFNHYFSLYNFFYPSITPSLSPEPGRMHILIAKRYVTCCDRGRERETSTQIHYCVSPFEIAAGDARPELGVKRSAAQPYSVTLYLLPTRHGLSFASALVMRSSQATCVNLETRVAYGA